jgi:hypothetical protein
VLLGRPPDLRILRCQVVDEVARDRQVRRLREVASRSAHSDRDHLATAGAFVDIRVDAPTLDVDTTEGYRPELDRVAAWVTAP